MIAHQGSLALLRDPVAQRLLQSTIPVRLAYTWHDGTPRVVPLWFHWTGNEVVMCGPIDAPKVDALKANPAVALAIDSTTWPYKSLTLRGMAEVEIVDGVAPEYEEAARRYFGEEQGRAWTNQIAHLSPQMARIKVHPTWAGIIDFETRFPSAIAKHMS